MAQKFVNNLTVKLIGDITTSQTTITVDTTSRFPLLQLGDWFYLTITDKREGGELRWEVVKVNSWTGTTLTCIRAQDGTTAQSWLSGSELSLRITAADMFDYEQLKDSKGQINGIAPLDPAGKIATNYLYDVVNSSTQTALDGKLNLSGGTMSGNIILADASQSLIQKSETTSNYGAILKWYKGGTSQATYDPQIGHHNTGGDGTGSISIIPFATENSPWEGGEGLFLTKTYAKFNNNTVWHSGNDGAGSGLDADTVDGYHVGTGNTPTSGLVKVGDFGLGAPIALGATDFNTLTQTGTYTIPAHANWIYSTNKPTNIINVAAVINVVNDFNDAANTLQEVTLENGMKFTRYRAWEGTWQPWVTVWTSAKQGSGSGLDADTVDGLHIGQSGANYIPYANGNGNVGIGTSSPSVKLDVDGVSSASGYRFTGASSSAFGVVTVDSGFYALHSDGVTYGYGISTHREGGLDIMANQSGQPIRFWCGTSNASPSERMRIDSNGNVLIGTNVGNGVDKLQVNGSISATPAANGMQQQINNHRRLYCFYTTTTTYNRLKLTIAGDNTYLSFLLNIVYSNIYATGNQIAIREYSFKKLALSNTTNFSEIGTGLGSSVTVVSSNTVTGGYEVVLEFPTGGYPQFDIEIINHQGSSTGIVTGKFLTA